MRYLLPFLFMGLTACHLPATLGAFPDQRYERAGYGYDYDGGTGWESEPLRAAVWLDEFSGRASFDLNRPAYVAVFAMRPLGGVEMIYPGWGWSHGGRAFASGRHTVRTESRLYHLARNSSRYGSAYRSAGQTYIILIASDRPLRLQPLLATGQIPWLDHPSITWNPFVATEHLAREIVPRHGGAEWTAAYHVVWPDHDLHRYDGRIPYTTVRCPGGALISIPTEVVRRGVWQCPGLSRPDDPDRPTTPARPRVDDAPPIRQALPRRPRPADWNGATPTTGDDRSAAPARPLKPTRVAPSDRTPATPPTTARPGTPGVERPRPDPRTSRPTATPGRAPRPSASPRPVASPRPAASPRPVASPRPTASPRPSASPRPAASPGRPKASPRPTVRRTPAARPAFKPVSKPAPKVKPKTKTKTKSGGGDG